MWVLHRKEGKSQSSFFQQQNVRWTWLWYLMSLPEFYSEINGILMKEQFFKYRSKFYLPELNRNTKS